MLSHKAALNPTTTTIAQAERDFQRSARSSMDAGLFFAAICQDPRMLRDVYEPQQRHPSARKNLEATSLVEDSEGAGQLPLS